MQEGEMDESDLLGKRRGDKLDMIEMVDVKANRMEEYRMKRAKIAE